MNLLATSTDKYQFGKTSNKGFTLIEILVVIAIISILGGLGAIYGFGNFRIHNFYSNSEILTSTLLHARAQAVINICRGDECVAGESHGVFIDEDNDRFVIFQGENYVINDSHNIYVEANKNINYSGISEIVFERLSGDVIFVDGEEIENGETSWLISIDDANSDKLIDININKEGRIEWED